MRHLSFRKALVLLISIATLTYLYTSHSSSPSPSSDPLRPPPSAPGWKTLLGDTTNNIPPIVAQKLEQAAILAENPKGARADQMAPLAMPNVVAKPVQAGRDAVAPQRAAKPVREGVDQDREGSRREGEREAAQPDAGPGKARPPPRLAADAQKPAVVPEKVEDSDAGIPRMRPPAAPPVGEVISKKKPAFLPPADVQAKVKAAAAKAQEAFAIAEEKAHAIVDQKARERLDTHKAGVLAADDVRRLQKAVWSPEIETEKLEDEEEDFVEDDGDVLDDGLSDFNEDLDELPDEEEDEQELVAAGLGEPPLEDLVKEVDADNPSLKDAGPGSVEVIEGDDDDAAEDVDDFDAAALKRVPEKPGRKLKPAGPRRIKDPEKLNVRPLGKLQGDGDGVDGEDRGWANRFKKIAIEEPKPAEGVEKADDGRELKAPARGEALRPAKNKKGDDSDRLAPVRPKRPAPPPPAGLKPEAAKPVVAPKALGVRPPNDVPPARAGGRKQVADAARPKAAVDV